jgi:hypothetical protein
VTRTARWLSVALLAGWPSLTVAQSQRPAPYLYVWAGDALLRQLVQRM